MRSFCRADEAPSNPLVYTGATLRVVERLGVRELRNQAATAIRRAGAGERIVITVDGRPVAQLGPLDPGHHPVTLPDLAVRGLVVLPRRTDRPGPGTTVRPWAGTRLDRMFDQVR